MLPQSFLCDARAAQLQRNPLESELERMPVVQTAHTVSPWGQPLLLRCFSVGDGVTWVVYEGAGKDGKPAEPVWTTRLTGPGGPAQVAVTGAAGTAEYRTLGAATQTASPLTAK